MENCISPSMMCADIVNLRETLDVFKKGNIEYLHIDVMDGTFIPNFALGSDFCRALKENCSIPLDIHLMIRDPLQKISFFPISVGDLVSVHIESSDNAENIFSALKKIRELGAKPIIALNPSTPISAIEDFFPLAYAVLIMTVNPGFAGQKMIPETLGKITALRKYLDAHGFENTGIEVDGNVSFENAALMKKAGANIFVAGSSSVFCKGMTLADAIAKMRDVIK